MPSEGKSYHFERLLAPKTLQSSRTAIHLTAKVVLAIRIGTPPDQTAPHGNACLLKLMLSMEDDPKPLLTCLVYLAREVGTDGMGPPYYWLQSATKAWCLSAPFEGADVEEALLHLPVSVRSHFTVHHPVLHRDKSCWALRLGMTELHETQLDEEWIPAATRPILFREPVSIDEADGNDRSSKEVVN